MEIQVKLNKRYLTRAGQIIKITRYNRDWEFDGSSKKYGWSEMHDIYPYHADNLQSYTLDGHVLKGSEHSYDIIQEIN